MVDFHSGAPSPEEKEIVNKEVNSGSQLLYSLVLPPTLQFSSN